MEDNAFDLVITSPPYNVGKQYETKESIEDYLAKQEKAIQELIRITSNKGSICWQVGNYVDNGEIFPLDIYYYQIFKKFGLKLRNRIIWHFGHGLHASNRFSGRYETILWFTKTDDYIFNLDDVRVPAKYPGKRHFKGSKKGQPSGNPKGKNPTDTWEIVLRDWEKELWDIPNVKSNHPEKTEHPCQFPVELVERCVLALTDEDSWVLDPYAGVGSTLLASVKNDRNVIGIDKEKIAVEVQFGKYAFVAYDLFVKHMLFYSGGVINLGIEILPTKNMQTEMSSGVAGCTTKFRISIKENWYFDGKEGMGFPSGCRVWVGKSLLFNPLTA